jgi:hypothetical protein
MHKFVTHKKNNFTMIDNALIYDNKISAKSKAVLIYLLSKPQEWKTSIRDISNSFKDGYDSIKSSLVELENEYYLTRTKYNCKKSGKFITQYSVYEDKTTNPRNINYKIRTIVENPLSSTAENPPAENPLINNKTVTTNIKKLYKKEFDLWYSLYDKKTTKKPALNYWNKNIKSMVLIDKIMIHTKLYAKNTEKKFRLDPVRYLRNEKWEDEIIEKEISQQEKEEKMYEAAERRMHKNMEKQKRDLKIAEQAAATQDEIKEALFGKGTNPSK